MSGSTAIIRFQHLDGLRGLFAVSVALSHIIGAIEGWSDSRPLVGAYLAVDYFFILSGFVLAHLLHTKKSNYIEFFKKRLFRLWPLHFLTTILIFMILWNNRINGLYYMHDIPLSADNIIL